MKYLFARKSIDELQKEAFAEDEHSMKRTLTARSLVLLGVGGVIGAGIFVITGPVAALHAGPAVAISFVIAGIACLFAGLCYSELTAMIPVAGSAYTYGYATMGEFIAWIIGWDLILEYLFSASTVAVGWSGYFVSLVENGFGVDWPESLTTAPFTVSESGELVREGIINLPAVLLVLFLTTLLVIGTRESAIFNNIIVYIKVSVLLLVIWFGFQYVEMENLTPFIPENTGTFGQFGWSGIIRGAGVVFFAYIGFDAITTAAQEVKNPQRSMPIGILGALLICTVLYILVSVILTGIVSYTELNVADSVFYAINATGALDWLGYLVNIAAIAGLASVVLVPLLGQPRIFYSMSRDGLLPAAFGKIHPRFRTPYVATIITGIVCALIAGFFPIGLLSELVSIGTLLAFAIVSAGVLYLRYKEPNRKRPFRTPFVPFVPIISIAICGYLMISLPWDTWLRLIIWMVIGFIIYFFYGRKNSKLRRTGEQTPMTNEPPMSTYTKPKDKNE